MKKLLVCMVLALLPGADAFAGTWIAKLDGIEGASSAGLQFNFGTNKGDPAIIYFKTKDSSGRGGIFEIARGKVTSVTSNEIMATFHRAEGASGQPMTRVTINRLYRTVNVLYHHPTNSQENTKDIFGVAESIQVVP
jgi:hypothetical protein